MPYVTTGEIIKEKLKNNIDWFEGEYTQEDHDNGKLAPDWLISKIIMNNISETGDNCILDGFPRTLDQCKVFTKHM